jgi:hypothetical protein
VLQSQPKSCGPDEELLVTPAEDEPPGLVVLLEGATQFADCEQACGKQPAMSLMTQTT